MSTNLPSTYTHPLMQARTHTEIMKRDSWNTLRNDSRIAPLFDTHHKLYYGCWIRTRAPWEVWGHMAAREAVRSRPSHTRLFSRRKTVHSFFRLIVSYFNQLWPWDPTRSRRRPAFAARNLTKWSGPPSPVSLAGKQASGKEAQSLME